MAAPHKTSDLEREKTPRQPTDLEREKTPSWKAYRNRPPKGGTLSPSAWHILDSVSRATGHNLEVQQGGHNVSGDPTSKGTHDGGGAVDLFVKGMSKQKQLDTVEELRRQGVAAWLRTPEYGWNDPNDKHIHAIFMDDPELSPVAVEQVKQYKKGLNGLANHAPDPFARPKRAPRNKVQTVSTLQQWAPVSNEKPSPQPKASPEHVAELMRRMTTTGSGFPLVGDKNNSVMRAAPSASEDEIWEEYKQKRLGKVHEEVGPPGGTTVQDSMPPVLVPRTKTPIDLSRIDLWSAPSWKRLRKRLGTPSWTEWLNRNI